MLKNVRLYPYFNEFRASFYGFRLVTPTLGRGLKKATLI